MDEKCSFCDIAGGRGQAAIVHDDPQAVAFMDGRPIRPGHVLVIPRAHVADIFNLAAGDYSHVFSMARRLAGALQSAFQPRRVGLVVAGFDVAHAHVHVIPMLEYHDITSRSLLEGTLGPAPLDVLLAQAARVRDHLSRASASTE